MCIPTSRCLGHCLRATLPEHEISVLRNNPESSQFDFMYYIHLNLVSFGITYSTQPAMEMATWYCVYHNLVSEDQGRKKRLHRCYKTATILLNELLCVLLEVLVETRDSAAILWYAVVGEHPQRRWTSTVSIRRNLSALYTNRVPPREYILQWGWSISNRGAWWERFFVFKIYFLLDSLWCNQRSTKITFLDL